MRGSGSSYEHGIEDLRHQEEPPVEGEIEQVAPTHAKAPGADKTIRTVRPAGTRGEER
jgi:hypothetical protein